MSNLEVRSYSERGMINAMIYEMKYSPKGIQLLRDFLELCVFPFSKPDFESFQSAKIRIEQSFSDFGDLDLLILLDGVRKQSVLLEAKVKTYQKNRWFISEEWDSFQQHLQNSKSVSNLFVQLYSKMQLIRKVKNPNNQLQGDAIATRQSLGKNQIVLKAAQELFQYSSEVWFVALVPDSKDNIERFFKQRLQPSLQNLPDWNRSNFGYLLWEELEDHCKQYPSDWTETLANFEYNQGQIFGAGPPLSSNSIQLPPPHSAVTWNSPSGPQTAEVKRRGKHNTRIILRDGSSEKAEKVVPNKQLEW